MINGMIDFRLIDDPAEIKKVGSPLGKAFARLTFEDGSVQDCTLTVLEMVGAAAQGTAIRLGYTKALN